MTNLKPFGPRVLVKRWPEVELHQSGLVLPASAREKPQVGRVLAIGLGVRHHKTKQWVGLDIEVGDDVVFEKFVSNDHELTINNEKLLLIPFDQLYLVLETKGIYDHIFNTKKTKTL